MKIIFYRNATATKGEFYESPLLTVETPINMPEIQAVIFAIEQFQKEMDVQHWQDLAHGYRIS